MSLVVLVTSRRRAAGGTYKGNLLLETPANASHELNVGKTVACRLKGWMLRGRLLDSEALPSICQHRNQRTNVTFVLCLASFTHNQTPCLAVSIRVFGSRLLSGQRYRSDCYSARKPPLLSRCPSKPPESIRIRRSTMCVREVWRKRLSEVLPRSWLSIRCAQTRSF